MTEVAGPDQLGAQYVRARSAPSPEFLWPESTNCAWPERGSQNCTPRSLEPDATHWPSGEHETERT